MEAMEISRSGLDVEWKRLQVIAQNIANINTTRTANGGAYQALRLVSGPVEGFPQILNGMRAGADTPERGVAVYDIAPVTGAARRHFDPAHPHADAEGFVTLPAVGQAEEMTLMVKTTRAYEANLVALSAAHQMYSSALTVGRAS